MAKELKKVVADNMQAINLLCKEAQKNWNFIDKNYKEKSKKIHLLEAINQLTYISNNLRKLKIDTLILASEAVDMTLREKLDIFYKIGGGSCSLWELFDKEEIAKTNIGHNIELYLGKAGFTSTRVNLKFNYLLGEYIVIVEEDYQKEINRIEDWQNHFKGYD
jgi:hypothetical protein